MLIQAAEKWDIDLGNSYMIGDTPKDVEAGKKAGAKGVLVKTGYGQEAVLEGIGPDHVAENVLDAVRWALLDAGNR